MNYVFDKASLTLTPDCLHKNWLGVVNVVLEVTANKKSTDPKILNPALNGKYVIKGLLDHHCKPSQSPICVGKQGVLKLSQNSKYTLVPILFVECLDITSPGPHRRCYSWYFGGLSKPIDDQIGLVSSNDGQISLDDLLEEIGASREMMEKSNVKFTAEGGFESK